MNRQLFTNGDHKFPVSTEALEFIQQQIFLVARLCSLAGTNVIVKQPTSTAMPQAPVWRDLAFDNTTAGLVIINGKLYPLYGDSRKANIELMPETTDTVQAGDVSLDVRTYNYAYYSDSGTPVSQFTTLDTIVRLMQRISNIEGTYMTENAIRTLVQTLQDSLNTTNGGLSSLTTRVQTIENNYRTAAQITELLNANAQHHIPKGSVIDWYGDATCDNIPYGFVPCGCFFAGPASQFAADGAGALEMAKWRTAYPAAITIRSVNTGTAFCILITQCNGQTVPDLTDRFIVQAGSKYALGDTGGQNQVTLTQDQMPEHTHLLGTLNSKGAFRVIDQEDGIQTLGAFTVRDRQNSAISGGGASDKWKATIDYDWRAGTTGMLSTTGMGNQHENRPPYFALYKLIKVI